MIQRRGAQKYPDTVWGKGNPPKVGRKNLSAWACAEEAQDCFFRTPSGEKALFMLGERQGQPLEAAAAGGAGSRSLLLRDLFHCPNTVPAGAGTDLEESNMVFGLLKDIKNGEYRTIATPAEIATIVADGHTALVQRGAGEKAGFEDQEYEKAGARLVDTMEDIYGQADFVTKVKELEPCEFPLLRPAAAEGTDHLHLHPSRRPPPGGPGHPGQRLHRLHRGGLFSGDHPEDGHGEGSSMRIYIVEDDTSVIGILEDIVEGNELGVVCGDSGGEPANLGQILALDPDLVLVDLLMPQKDGIQVVRELKEQGCRAKFIMISQVSNKEMVAKAYLAGVDFFINKPINLIEVRQVILNVRRQLENERDLHTIQSVFAEKAAPVGRRSRLEAQRKRIQTTLSQLGMAGEKGARDIVELCMLLLEQGQQVSQVGVGALCAQLSDSPKSMEQRARRAVERGLHHLASLGLEDYGNEIFTLYASRLFPFQEVRAEMACIQGRGPKGKANLKRFLDGMLVLVEED